MMLRLLERQSVSVTGTDEDALRKILDAADGLPLAIVISAAWLADMPPQSFLRSWTRSRSAMQELPGVPSPDRFSSVHVSVGLSIQSLEEAQVDLLRVLSLLPAGAAMETLDLIPTDSGPVAVRSAELVRRSLVERDGTGLRMLAPIREFVLVQMPATRKAEITAAVIRAHTDFLREALVQAYAGHGADVWSTVDRALRNVAPLVDQGLETHCPGPAMVDLVVSASLAFRATGRINDGVASLDKVSSVVIDDGSLFGILMEEKGHLQRAAARLDEALESYGLALETWDALGARSRQAVCYLRLGDVLRVLGQYPDAEDAYRLGAEAHELAGCTPLERGDAIECMGDLARMRGAWDVAERLYVRAQELFASVGNGLVGMTNTSHSLGETWLACDQHERAEIEYEDALRISRDIGDAQGEANATLGLAKVSALEGRYVEAG
ncbi:MAG: tetratricopeptide repeat protein [Micrococcales bacterium]|nr:tetratricopeptide repeat protein [Micrococcales bacterium]